MVFSSGFFDLLLFFAGNGRYYHKQNIGKEEYGPFFLSEVAFETLLVVFELFISSRDEDMVGN